MKRILIVKRDKIGDMLLTTPLFAHLKAARPDLEMHVLANDYNAWVLAGNPDVDRLWVYRRSRAGGRVRLGAALHEAALMLALRWQRFDAVLIGNGEESARAIQRGLRVGARRTVAYCDAARHPGVSDPLEPLPGSHESERLIALAAPLGIAPPPASPLPRYVFPAAEEAAALAWLAENGLTPGAYVVLGLGARRPKKQPTALQVLDWTGRIKREFGLDTVFMWTPGRSDNPDYPGDDDVAQPVLDARAPRIKPFRGPLRPAIGLLWHARISLFPDSGLMHFAAASPGGVLGFFAETDVSPNPAQWGPRGHNVAYLEAEKSVAELSSDAVLARVAALVSGSALARPDRAG